MPRKSRLVNSSTGMGGEPPKKGRSVLYESAATGDEQSWADLSSEAMEALYSIADCDIAFFIGKTRDGGRLSLTILDNEEDIKVRWYETAEGMSNRLIALWNHLDTSPR